MANAEDYANWIVQNQDKRGTPEFDVVAKAYASSRRAPIDVPTVADVTAADVQKLPWLDRQIMAAGTAPANLVEGVKEIFGQGNPQRVATARRLAADNPGPAVLGNLAMFAPTAMIPGANTYTGSAAIGGIMGALQPTAEGESRLTNTATGTLAGIAGKGLGDTVATAVTSREASEVARQARNALKDATLQRSKEAGYVLPKSEVAPTFLNNRMESLAGKAALKQGATLRNQEVTNTLGRKVIDLGEDQPLSRQAIEAFRDRVSEPYRKVAAMGEDAAATLEKLKDVRAEAKLYWNHYNRTATPESLRTAKLLQDEASKLEGALEDMARVTDMSRGKGPTDLVQALRDSRIRLAQSHDLERAMNPATGDIDATVLARLLQKGKPLSDELRTAADFATAYPKFAGSGPKTPAPGVGKAEALVAALLGAGGAATMGPAGMAAAALPLASGPARAMLLSGPYQRLAVNPTYGPGVAARLARALSPQLPVAVTQGTLPQLRQQ